MQCYNSFKKIKNIFMHDYIFMFSLMTFMYVVVRSASFAAVNSYFRLKLFYIIRLKTRISIIDITKLIFFHKRRSYSYADSRKFVY